MDIILKYKSLNIIKYDFTKKNISFINYDKI
jgi:hypothetical protein